MATQPSLPDDTRASPSPDGVYAFVAGLYVAAILTPAAMVVFVRFVTDPAGVYVAFLVALTLLTAVAGLLVTRTRGLAIRLGRREVTRLLAVVPLLWFAVIAGVAAAGRSISATLAVFAGVSAIGGTLLGVVLTAMSRNRYAAARLAGAETLAEWEARWPRRWRRGAIAIMIVSGVLGGIGFLGQFVAVLEPASILFPLFYVWPVLAGAVNPRTFTVTDVGLLTGRPLVKRLRPWSTIEGYSLTDDALVVRRQGWWRPALRSDRDDVDDVDRVVAVLEDVTSS